MRPVDPEINIFTRRLRLAECEQYIQKSKGVKKLLWESGRMPVLGALLGVAAV